MKIRDENRSGYKKAKIGWIPKEWHIRRLGTIASLKRGKFSARPRNSPRYYDNGTIPFVQTGDISSAAKYVRAHSQVLNDEGLSVSKVFPAGTILMTIAANIGDVGILAYDMACPDSLIGLSAREGCDQDWLFYFLASQKHSFESYAPQNTQKNINLETLRPYPVPLPPLPEQKLIAKVLSTWERGIEQMERLVTLNERRKRALMQQLLTGKHRFPEYVTAKAIRETPLGMVAKDWPLKRLMEVFKRVRRKNRNSIKLVLTASGEHGLVDQKTFFERNVAGTSLEGYYLLKRGEFAYNRSAMNGYPYGAIKRLDAHDQGAVSTLYHCFALAEKKADSDFFVHLFELGLLNQQLRRICQVGGRAHGLMNVTASDFEMLLMPVPDKQEQCRIATVLNACDVELGHLRTRHTALKQQKKGLMQKLLTGQIRVTAPDGESE